MRNITFVDHGEEPYESTSICRCRPEEAILCMDHWFEKYGPKPVLPEIARELNELREASLRGQRLLEAEYLANHFDPSEKPNENPLSTEETP